jgi:hypothetical protein
MEFKLKIQHSDWDEFVDKFNKLNKKAKKIGTEPLTFECDNIPVKGEDGNVVYNVYINCPEIPKINGWKFIASIETVKKEDGSYLNLISGSKADQVKHLRNYRLTCEHCNVNRYRKYYFVVQNEETCETKVVGSSCLKDFLGHDPKHSIDIFKIHKEFEDVLKEPGFGGVCCRWISIQEVLETTFAVIRNLGYKKREYIDEDFEECTWETVDHQIYDKKFKKNKTGYETIYDIKDIDKEKTEMVIEHWKQTSKTIDINTASDIDYKKYLFIQMNCEIPFLVKWLAPCVGIAYGTWKQIEKEQNKKNRKYLLDGFFGEIKKRDNFELEVTHVNYIDSYYGTKTIIGGYRKDTNQKWVWFASGEKSKWEKKKGDVVTVKATIKNHQTHERFGDQTILTRVNEI